ncbi:bifunctional diguanylate cyclase/phosphodiesterase [Aliidiomarina iranensis]|uniref:Bifunctional diguanylate cyclase/phosphodiesterase n=1 Tax=Aliidiomarina iranensis TaxID=1434071 RepID=A0A432VZP6_9GAMM|nr:EAL domain-containing protein [Aliidiomarina iranensis]RUO22239.1 bifunctional diguanylate cyclase/phosphodiesterase [Aliidiomarina iranensis]
MQEKVQLSILLSAVIGLVVATAWLFVRNRKQNMLLENEQALLALVAQDASLVKKLNTVCKLIEQQIASSLCTVMIRDFKANVLRVVENEKLPISIIEPLRELNIRDGVGACGTAAATGESVIVADMMVDARFTDFIEVIEKHNLRACWSFPFFNIDQEVVGTFALYFDKRKNPSNRDLRLIEQTRDLVGLIYAQHLEKNRRMESEEHYRSLHTYNPETVFTLDENGKFLQMNEAGLRLLGLSETAIIGQHYSKVVRAQDLERTHEHFVAALNGEAQRYEIQIFNQAGETLDVDITNMPIVVSGKITGIHGIATNITQRLRDQGQLQILQRSVEASVNGIVIADGRKPGYPLVYVNPAFQKITGYTASEILGKTCKVLQGEGSDKRALEQIRNGLKKERDVQTTIRNYRKDGTAFWNDLYLAPVRDQKGELTHYIGIQNDVTARKEQEEQVAWHATHDPLTRLPNRSLLEDRLEQAFRFSRRYQRNLAVMFIDLDGFKPVNDSMGHSVGDALLCAVAERIQNTIRDGDTLARFGGDEFVVVLPNAGTESDINEIAERFLFEIAEPYKVGNKELTLTASIGLALSDEDLDDPRLLIQRADMAMYKAKRRGNNNFEWFTQDINDKVERHVLMRHEIQEALKCKQFSLVYQPIFDQNQKICSVEALIRWNHPVQGVISPYEFITLAEHTGQIIPMGRWVIEQVCQDMLQLQAMDIPTVSVNLSPLQLSRNRFADDIKGLLAEYQIEARQIVLEVTENVLVSDLTNASSILNELHKQGFRIAIDDFGTGYSSLRYLQELPIDILKIDRSFVCDVGEGKKYEGITRAMLAVAQELQLQVVAEGVETEEQLTFLKTQDCEFYQGYLLALPMAIDDLARFCEQKMQA